MKKWLIYVLGIITGIVLTFAFAFCVNLSNNSGIIGLEMFEEPGEDMEYTQFEVFQVLDSGCALANADDTFDATVFIIPDDKQQFYDNQKIVLKNDQCAQRVGTYRYSTKKEIEKTVPAVKIIDGVESKSNKTIAAKNNSGKTLFDKPGECVSRKNFEVQKVLESGDAIALEVTETLSGYVLTSDLEVLILAQDGSNFYNNQIVKAPQGKCARQIGNYKYQRYGTTKVIPIIAFK
ncbi:MAG: hypothetical protein K2L39_04710 [Muribaculaceae bacterium]|nr:hypothetical protein [Muribaculaceae bacterium]